MKKRIMSTIIGLLLGMGMTIAPVFATTIGINLNDFHLEGPGSIASDGSWAIIEQEAVYGQTYLGNEPKWGDPGISLPSGALTLSFDYTFFESSGNDTDFYVELVDGVTGDFIDGLLVQNSTTGAYLFDVTSLLAGGQNLLGLIFSLTEYQYTPENGKYNVGSNALIRNLQLTLSDQVPVPEPASLLLLGVGMIILGAVSRKRLS